MDNRQQVIDAAVRGDKESLSTLLEEIGPQVRRSLSISSQYQGIFDDSDVMQVTYLEAFLRIKTLRNRTPDGFVAWLRRIAQNNLRDVVKSLNRAKRPNPGRRVSSVEDSSVDLVEAFGYTSTTASRHEARREALQSLDSALDKLPESYAIVVRQYDLEGRAVKEVAQNLNRSEGAVYMLRARAHERLRELLGTASEFFSG